MLLIIDSHPVQYRVPVYREISRRLEAAGSRLHVLYGSDSSVRGARDEGFGREVAWDEAMLDGYSHEFLPGAGDCAPGGFRAIDGAAVARRIRALQPNAVLLNGINYRLFVRAGFAARRCGIPVWLRSETQDDAFARSPAKGLARRLVYRVAYSLIDHFFPIGELNAAHYRAHGVPPSRQTFARYCVVDRFDAPEPELLTRRAAKRAALDLPDDVRVVMFSGKLIPKKNPGVLLEALALLPPEARRRYAILYVGSGELEPALRVAAAGIEGARVVFAGFVNQGEIADYYLASDALALPSRQMGETWGLVANEALLAGRPLILSRHAGSSADFQGFPGVQVVDPNPEEVLTAFRNLPGQPRGAGLRDALQGYSVTAAAEALAVRFLKDCA